MRGANEARKETRRLWCWVRRGKGGGVGVWLIGWLSDMSRLGINDLERHLRGICDSGTGTGIGWVRVCAVEATDGRYLF